MWVKRAKNWRKQVTILLLVLTRPRDRACQELQIPTFSDRKVSQFNPNLQQALLRFLQVKTLLTSWEGNLPEGLATAIKTLVHHQSLFSNNKMVREEIIKCMQMANLEWYREMEARMIECQTSKVDSHLLARIPSNSNETWDPINYLKDIAVNAVAQMHIIMKWQTRLNNPQAERQQPIRFKQEWLEPASKWLWFLWTLFSIRVLPTKSGTINVEELWRPPLYRTSIWERAMV